MGLEGSAEGIAIPAEDAPVELQIEYLRGQVESLRDKIREEGRARQLAITAAYDDLSTTTSTLDEQLRTLDGRVTDLAAGSTWRQLWGLVLVGTGSALTALPALFRWS